MNGDGAATCSIAWAASTRKPISHELLMKQDQMSMAASIESRVPFLDDQLVEHVVGTAVRVQGARLADQGHAARGRADLVPPEILTRRKMGFPVPVGRWLKSGFRPLVEEFVLGPRAPRARLFDRRGAAALADEHASGARRHGDRLWLLVNLEIWQRIFHDGESPDHVMRVASPTPTAGSMMRILWVKMGGLWPPTTGGRSAQPADRLRAVAAS